MVSSAASASPDLVKVYDHFITIGGYREMCELQNDFPIVQDSFTQGVFMLQHIFTYLERLLHCTTHRATQDFSLIVQHSYPRDFTIVQQSFAQESFSCYACVGAYYMGLLHEEVFERLYCPFSSKSENDSCFKTPSERLRFTGDVDLILGNHHADHEHDFHTGDPGQFDPADLATKPLPRSEFERHILNDNKFSDLE